MVVVAAFILADCSGSASRSAFCKNLEHARPDFAPGSGPEAIRRALDATIAAAAPRDRKELLVIRAWNDFVANGSHPPAETQQMALEYGEAVRSLDHRLERECGIPLDDASGAIYF